MSSLWRDAGGMAWEAVPVGGVGAASLELASGRVRLIRYGTPSDGGVALLARPGIDVRVNGLILPGNLRVLQHRDEILINGQRYYFSAESKPQLTVFHLEAGTRRPTCPVCRGPLHDGDTAVRCPGCSRWFHQIEAREGKRARLCWTYAPRCRFCEHPTALTGEESWSPEQEECNDAAR